MHRFSSAYYMNFQINTRALHHKESNIVSCFGQFVIRKFEMKKKQSNLGMY